MNDLALPKTELAKVITESIMVVSPAELPPLVVRSFLGGLTVSLGEVADVWDAAAVVGGQSVVAESVNIKYIGIIVRKLLLKRFKALNTSSLNNIRM